VESREIRRGFRALACRGLIRWLAEVTWFAMVNLGLHGTNGRPAPPKSSSPTPPATLLLLVTDRGDSATWPGGVGSADADAAALAAMAAAARGEKWTGRVAVAEITCRTCGATCSCRERILREDVATTALAETGTTGAGAGVPPLPGEKVATWDCTTGFKMIGSAAGGGRTSEGTVGLPTPVVLGARICALGCEPGEHL
jgi:hypothetical protein